MQYPLSRALRVAAFCGLGLIAAQSLYYPASAAEPAAIQHARADQDFSRLKRAFLKALWKQDTEIAMGAGKFDAAATLTIPNQASRAAWLTFAADWLARIKTIPEEKLSTSQRTDLLLMRNFLQSNQWYLSTFREYEWNPTQYNIGGGFDAILNAEFAPKAKRVRLAIARLHGVPAYYEAAKQSIERPTIEHTHLAIAQSAGALAVLDDLAQAVQQLPKTDALSNKEQTAFTQDLAAARGAVNDFTDWLGALEKTLEPATARSFRIGKQLYEGKFAADIQSSFSAEQTYQRALVAKEEAHRNMEKLADQLWTSVMGNAEKPTLATKKIAMVIDKLSEQHVEAKNLLSEIRNQLPVLQNWIRDHHLVDLDPKRPLVVRETPIYERASVLPRSKHRAFSGRRTIPITTSRR
jgi:predicted DNA-binding ribbon-helix-helix protein